MYKVLCPTCSVSMTVKNAGVAVIETYLQPPQPYRLWFADLLYCPACMETVVSGFGEQCFAGNWQPDFAETYDALMKSDLATNKIVATLSMSKEQSAKIGEILTHAPNW